jgi:hypothetical protein
MAPVGAEFVLANLYFSISPATAINRVRIFGAIRGSLAARITASSTGNSGRSPDMAYASPGTTSNTAAPN